MGLLGQTESSRFAIKPRRYNLNCTETTTQWTVWQTINKLYIWLKCLFWLDRLYRYMNKESFMFSPFNFHQMLVWIRICCCRSEYVTGNLRLWRLLSFYFFKWGHFSKHESEEAGLILLYNAGWLNLLDTPKSTLFHKSPDLSHFHF